MASSNPFGLVRKVALITGATSGIGKRCALAFAREGCFVAITGRNTEALQEVTKLCHDAGLPKGKVLSISADLSVDKDCKRVVESTMSHFGYLDILINNAGILIRGGIQDTTMEEFEKQMNINTRSPFLMTKLSLPHILERKGNIVNVSSVVGLRVAPQAIAYSMSKAALDHLTRSVAMEVAGRGVRVNAVNPGLIVTDLHRRSGMSNEVYRELLEKNKTMHALGRVGEVEEVAGAVVFLASNKASFITGETLSVDGGRHCMNPR